MSDKIRILDKTKAANRRCSSCEYWKEYTNEVGLITHRCMCSYSDSRFKDKHYWNCCNCFTWAKNIIDKNER